MNDSNMNDSSSTNTVLIVIVLLLIVGFGVWWFSGRGPVAPADTTGDDTDIQIDLGAGTEDSTTPAPVN